MPAKQKTPTPDTQFIDPDLVALYDLENEWRADSDYYDALPQKPAMRILDLGCGTGLIAAMLAQAGHHVTGVDPAGPMLAVARNRPGGDKVRWLQGIAADIPAHDQFDLAIMTGHAFQTLQSDDEIVRNCRDVAAHLAPDGQFVFETRNPAMDWVARWRGAFHVSTDAGVIHAVRMPDRMTSGRLRFVTTYYLPGGPRSSTSTLRFADLSELRRLLGLSGLDIADVAGDWDGQPFDPATSPEIIIHARLAA
jgi:SAM-dependent methyltransferase